MSAERSVENRSLDPAVQQMLIKAATPSTYRKVVFSPDGERLVGVLFIGDISRAGIYRYLIRGNSPVRRIKSHIIDHSLHYGNLLKID